MYWAKDFTDNPIHPTFKTYFDKEIRLTNKKIKSSKSLTLLLD